MDDKQLLLTNYMRMARIWAENSQCKRRQVGALLVKNKNDYFRRLQRHANGF